MAGVGHGILIQVLPAKSHESESEGACGSFFTGITNGFSRVWDIFLSAQLMFVVALFNGCIWRPCAFFDSRESVCVRSVCVWFTHMFWMLGLCCTSWCVVTECKLHLQLKQGITKKGSRGKQFINECLLFYRKLVGCLIEKCCDWLIDWLIDRLIDKFLIDGLRQALIGWLTEKMLCAYYSLHLTNMCVQYPASTVACVCIFLAAKWARYQVCWICRAPLMFT